MTHSRSRAYPRRVRPAPIKGSTLGCKLCPVVGLRTNWTSPRPHCLLLSPVGVPDPPEILKHSPHPYPKSAPGVWPVEAGNGLGADPAACSCFYPCLCPADSLARMAVGTLVSSSSHPSSIASFLQTRLVQFRSPQLLPLFTEVGLRLVDPIVPCAAASEAATRRL